MILKKLNAVLGLLSILFLLMHAGYSIFSYFTFYYNPFLQKLFSIPVMIAVCLHAVLGMLIVFTRPDGTEMTLYKKLNMRIVLQRVSAALIFPLLIIHINTFSWMNALKASGLKLVMIILILAEILFFAVVITHVSVSFTNAFITLGLLSLRETQKKIDRVVYVIGAVLFVTAVFVIVKGQITMFFMG
ncbi:MAG: hypothetical protein K6B28_13880 [Lachnospiraceae bacterium]|nr:hypothetical protein [Lachnospiraceae bacterium]